MKKTHKILYPNMCVIHFSILGEVFRLNGYDMEMLTDTDSSVINEGLKYVHNDTCYPALITIGQFISALKSGNYDVSHTALMMTQTGGGCRASNYIHLLRKALKNAGMAQVPVISLNIARMEKNGGFKLTLPLLRAALAAITYGDMLMMLSNRTRPYEIKKGTSDALVSKWVEEIVMLFEKKKATGTKEMRSVLKKMVDDFERIELDGKERVKVGIVGEIFVKYSPLANNGLEKFLQSQDCEVNVPGLMGFLLYTVDVRINHYKLYGGSAFMKKMWEAVLKYLLKYENMIIDAVGDSKRFIKPTGFDELKKSIDGVIGIGCEMGEGWLLSAEMTELIKSGYENVICAQPFGCLPNHIAGKGVIRKLRTLYPQSNIVPIDYDPGATKVNQENRIKLMLAVAKENLENKNGQTNKS
ncbi:MAG: 2-hydroxyacyl-CoA dehydratase [Clostridia bacterium]|nr:2-hydroxyacyl-CoA dehydratase [Clostridia bacterium]